MDRGLLAMAGEAQGVDSDAAVMLRVKQGDDAAFDYLVQKYRRAMLSFMFRMAHNSAAAEDLSQEVFLRVYRSRENYEPSAKFTTWLYRIATNLAVNHARDTRHDRPENMASLDEPDEESGQTLDVADRHTDGRAEHHPSGTDECDPGKGSSVAGEAAHGGHHA